MNGNVATRLGHGLRDLVPLATAFIAVVADLLPLAGLGPDAVTPSLTLVVAYFWCLHRPDLLSALDLFALGLLVDLIGATPPGTTSLTLLAARRLVLAPQRLVLARSFEAGWLGFLATLALVQGLRWGIMSILHGSLFPMAPLGIEAVLTAALYPIAAVVLLRIAHALEAGDDAAQG